MRLIAYGYFGRDHGSRSVDLPIGALLEWKLHAKELWSDFASPTNSEAVHLYPQTAFSSGVLSLWVLVSTDFEEDWAICAVDCVFDDSEVTYILKIPTPVTGYALLRDVDIAFWGNAIFKRRGLIVRGSDPLQIADGEVIRVLIDEETEASVFLQAFVADESGSEAFHRSDA